MLVAFSLLVVRLRTSQEGLWQVGISIARLSVMRGR